MTYAREKGQENKLYKKKLKIMTKTSYKSSEENEENTSFSFATTTTFHAFEEIDSELVRRADGTRGVKHPSWPTLMALENTRRDMLRRVSTII